MSEEITGGSKRSPENLEDVDPDIPSPKRTEFEDVEEVAVDTEISLPTTEVATEQDTMSGKSEFVVNRSGSPGVSGAYSNVHGAVYSPSNVVNFQTNPAAINSALEMLMQMQQAFTQKVGQTSQSSPPVTGQSTTDSESAPVYLMVPSTTPDYMQSSRTLAPRRDGDPGNMKVVSDHEMQRKASHNEVERRRRERINELTRSLAKLIPACQKESTTSGKDDYAISKPSQSKANLNKGFVLEKAIEHIKELTSLNSQLTELVKNKEQAHNALQVLQGQITILEKENEFLRFQLKQLSMHPATSQQNLSQLLLQGLKSVKSDDSNSSIASALASHIQLPSTPSSSNGVPSNSSMSPSQSATVPATSASGNLFLAQSLLPQLVEASKGQQNSQEKSQKPDSSEEAHIITTTT